MQDVPLLLRPDAGAGRARTAMMSDEQREELLASTNPSLPPATVRALQPGDEDAPPPSSMPPSSRKSRVSKAPEAKPRSSRAPGRSSKAIPRVARAPESADGRVESVGGAPERQGRLVERPSGAMEHAERPTERPSRLADRAPRLPDPERAPRSSREPARPSDDSVRAPRAPGRPSKAMAKPNVESKKQVPPAEERRRGVKDGPRGAVSEQVVADLRRDPRHEG
jgi:hypothetical protein